VSQFVIVGVASVLLSQNADPAKGDMLLKAMSRKLAEAQSFSFSTTESHNRLKRNGERIQISLTRDVLVKRPNGFWTKYTGDRDFEFWYDGKLLTGISRDKRIYVQHEMLPTIDETLDLLAQRLNLDLPMSDVLYSSPYDAFMDDQTTGGFISKEVVDGAPCSHLSYRSPPVDWQLWINDKNSLPSRLELKYKKEKGGSFYRISFSKWNLKPNLKKDAFLFEIPEGYVRIPILERVVIQPNGSAQTQTKTSQNP
jgi:hypothetical protein